MFTDNTLKIPARVFPSHKISSDALYFIPEADFNFNQNNPFTNQTPVLQKGTELLVLEHGIGFKGQWCRVKLSDNRIGFIKFQNSLEALENTLPFYNLSRKEKLLPNPLANQIDWKAQNPNIVYEDDYNGALVVQINLENVVQFGNQNSLAFHMEEARKLGLKLILDHAAFVYTEESFQKLLNDYYRFCTAEDWFLDPRPCSTLRVAVALPKRYLYADSVLVKDSTGETTQPQPDTQQLPDNVFKLIFKNYKEYSDFFSTLLGTLGAYNFIYIGKEWTTTPDGGVDLFFEADQIKKFIFSTNQLLARNHPNKSVPDILALGGSIWEDSLELHIDRERLEILSIKYFSKPDPSVGLEKTFSLKNGFISYLKSLEVTNKTTINYLINFKPLEDAYPQPSNIQVKEFDLAKAIKEIETLVANGCPPPKPFGPDEDLRKFLTSKHYPIILDIQPTPLDIINCTIDTVGRVNQLLTAKLPSELAKWEQINSVYQKNRVAIEGDYFRKNLQGINQQLSDNYVTISDPRLRILFGIDKQEGKTEQEKLFTYLSIANSVDWSKYIALATQCLSIKLPPNIITCMLNVYKEATKYIQDLAYITTCNPSIKRGLNFINGISLPTLEVYNSSEILARELENGFYKILTDLASALLKSALNAAAKACAGNPNQNFNNGAGAPANPFSNPSAAEDPAVNDILDDAIRAVANNPGISPQATREGVKERLKEIIDDISVCLSINEMCSLYNGKRLNDEVFLVIIALIKRKYGSPYSELFSTREQISRFFLSLGKRMDLSVCEDITLDSEGPYLSNPNILCDDGRLQVLRKKLLADHGLSQELIDELLNKIRLEEAKALQDILKLLNSPNPLDLSKVPDLSCRVFPSGVSVAPSMDSFSSMINGLTKHLYDNFDNEAPEWFKTTYSIRKPTSSNFLIFNEANGKIEVNKSISIDPKTSENIRANSGKEDRATQEKNSNIDDLSEIKLPAFLLKDVLSKNNQPRMQLLPNNNTPILYHDFLDSYKQQQLDVNYISRDLTEKIKNGEESLSIFGSKLLAYINGKFIGSIVQSKLSTEQIIAAGGTGPSVISGLIPLGRYVYLLSMFLNNNPLDIERNSAAFKDLYEFFKAYDIAKSGESNSIFAQETGGIIYLLLGRFLFETKGWDTIVQELDIKIDDPSKSPLQALYNNAAGDYQTIKTYYTAVVNLKVAYPDYDINLLSGLTRVQYLTAPTAIITTSSAEYQNILNNRSSEIGKSIIIESYDNNKLYDLQRMEILRNKTNYIKFTERTEVNSSIYNFITGTLKVTNPAQMTKPKLFFSYLLNKMSLYGQGTKETKGTTQQLYNNLSFGILERLGNLSSLTNESPQEIAERSLYDDLNKKLFSYIKDKISSRDNKFIHLKDTRSPYITAIQESGSGIPYTKYLKLVIPQTPKQKICNVRPHYLDIDSIKKEIVQEKSENMCVEVIADRRTVGSNAISTNDLENIETTSTQDTMLRSMYRLAVRVFLHDILLRGIPLFGTYDPQSLRDEPAFITFMAKIAESEIRGIDNTFFYMLTGFLLKHYKTRNPDEIIENEKTKRSELFRDLVKEELQKFVLSKLAKRIGADTNFELINDVPKNNPILLVNVYEDLINFNDVLIIKGNSVYLKTGLKIKEEQTTRFTQITGEADLGPQKIYENGPANQDPQVTFNKFLSSVDFEFLFKYIFPATQPLNYFFVLSCLSAITRKQVVNSFMGTKREVIQLCKTIQTNGQSITPNPNDIQSTEVDPMLLIVGELLKSLLTTPLKILKGVAESSEPNIAITSTAFKIGRAFVPELPSIIIPAVSIPLGTIPTPITCPLPFINPLLAAAYFATLGWLDEKEAKSATKALEEVFNNATTASLNCSDTFNQDLFYLNNSPIGQEPYSSSVDFEALRKTLALENINEVTAENLSSAGYLTLDNEVVEERKALLSEATSISYTYNKAEDVTYASNGQPNYTTVSKTETLNQFMNDTNSRDYFSGILRNVISEVEAEINKPVQGLFGPEKPGTFILLKQDIITYLSFYLGKDVPKLKIGSEFTNWADAYNFARTKVLEKTKEQLKNYAINKRQDEFAMITTPETPVTQQQATQERVQNRIEQGNNRNDRD